MKWVLALGLIATLQTGMAKDIVFLKNESSKKVLQQCQVKFDDSYIEVISFSKKQLNCLSELEAKKSLTMMRSFFFEDTIFGVNNGPALNVRAQDEQVFALAKKEFGIPDFLKKHPTYDGRGIVGGVIDDGVSPHHSGFQQTTTGERKYIGHFSNSTEFTFDLIDNVEETVEFEGSPITPKHIVIFDEKKFGGDYNGDGDKTELKFIIHSNESGDFLCLDQDTDNQYAKTDCQRDFKSTGEYGFWLPSKSIPMMAWIDLEKKKLRISEGEWKRDSHGEGVASVFVGHNLFGKYDGVAPGAKLLDYDLSEYSNKTNEKVYTIGKFLKGISVLAENGANVINMSYSFYFYSAASQKLMSKALDALIKKYNVVLVFSAGNNGPGLGSMNRSLIYPKNSLVAGAYISKEMDALVHGATGIDDQGQVVYYSSLGPGADYGQGPSVISPLASITHSDAASSTRSFSGTSSAAPALAGFTAVLMSAISQENLPLKVDAIVAAVKMSAKPLKNTPFVFQGTGLPQIGKALSLYRLIIKGELPTLSVLGSSMLPQRDGVYSRGVLHNRQDVPEKEEFRLVLTSKFILDQTDLEDEQNLKIVNVEYSHPWLSGPKRTWVTNYGGAAISVTANYSKIPEGEHESFGEIKLVDRKTKSVLGVFPVSVLNQHHLSDLFREKITLSPESAHRIHFVSGNDVNGLRARFDLGDFSGERVTYRLYDKNHVKIESGSIIGGEEKNIDFTLKANTPYQLTFSRYRGNETISFPVKLTPIKVVKKTRTTKASGAIKVKNLSPEINGYIGLKTIIDPAQKGLVEGDISGSFKFSYEIQEVGVFSVSLKQTTESDLTYFSDRCFQTVEEINDSTSSDSSTLTTDQGLSVLSPEMIGKKVNVECFIFDFAEGVEFDDALEYQVFNESKKDESWSRRTTFKKNELVKIDLAPMKLSKGKHLVVLETDQGATLDLGQVEIYE